MEGKARERNGDDANSASAALGDAQSWKRLLFGFMMASLVWLIPFLVKHHRHPPQGRPFSQERPMRLKII